MQDEVLKAFVVEIKNQFQILNVIVMLCLMLYMYHVHVIVYANKDYDDYY